MAESMEEHTSENMSKALTKPIYGEKGDDLSKMGSRSTDTVGRISTSHFVPRSPKRGRRDDGHVGPKRLRRAVTSDGDRIFDTSLLHRKLLDDCKLLVVDLTGDSDDVESIKSDSTMTEGRVSRQHSPEADEEQDEITEITLAEWMENSPSKPTTPMPWETVLNPRPASSVSNVYEDIGGKKLGAICHAPELGLNLNPSDRHTMSTARLSNPGFRNIYAPASSSGFRLGGGPFLPTLIGPSVRRAVRIAGELGHAARADAFDRLTDEPRIVLDKEYAPIAEEELEKLLSNIRPDVNIPKENRVDVSLGLKYSLYPHQVIALNWMIDMEKGTNKGGILADDMGLGKTISTLALMLARPGPARSKVRALQQPKAQPAFLPKRKQGGKYRFADCPQTNLIVGPLSLLRQWEEEIKSKTKSSHTLAVFRHHDKKATIHDFYKYDVVVTTYGTLVQELIHHDKFMEENKDRTIDFNDKSLTCKFPLLHPKVEFHRIILDEAQFIKNRVTYAAKACSSVKATHRWCLTGTPMMNGVAELYSPLEFLRIKPYDTWIHFRQAFGSLFGECGDPRSTAMDTLRALLKAVMLRREKNSTLDGKPIVQLPPKKEYSVYVKLSTDERDFYKQLEEKAQVVFNKYLREGTVGKNYSNILVLLLRLRQACCHPHLNLDVDDAVSPLGDERLQEIVEKLEQSTINRIKGVEAFECPVCFDAVPSPSFLVPCGHHSCWDCVSHIVDKATSQRLQEDDKNDEAKCPVCRGDFRLSECFSYELLKKVHMPETTGMVNRMDDAGDYGDELPPLGDLVEEAARRGKNCQTVKEKRQEKDKKKEFDIKPSKLKSLRLEASKNREAYKRYMRYLRRSWLPAAKVTECINLLKSFKKSRMKTVVFSQWTLLLDLLEVAMSIEQCNVQPLRYDGSMSGDQRNAAVKDFRDSDKPKVMLVSLRAGNAGLNLTAATRVIIMDPFWNPYIEMQAIDRTYRIGQRNEVQVYRILTEETVEDRIVELQKKKKKIVEAALDEREGMRVCRLGVGELKILFNAGNEI